MIKIFKTFGGYAEITEPQKGCWINATNPSPDEANRLTEEFRLPDDLLNDILDQDERPRVEFDDDWALIILQIPVEAKNNGVPFHTIPPSIF